MRRILILTVLASIFSSTNALAVDSNVTFGGNVINGSCVLDAADTNKIVNLPSRDALSIKEGGYRVNTIGFTFNFNNCPISVSKINSSISFNGEVRDLFYAKPDSTSTLVWALMKDNNQAPLIRLDGVSTTDSQVNVSNGVAALKILVGAQRWGGTTVKIKDYTGSFNLTFTYV